MSVARHFPVLALPALLLGLPLAVGCDRHAKSDAVIYAQLVALDAPDPARDLPRCRALSHADSVGDCELVIARNAATSAGVSPTTWCNEISSEAWRDECWFLGAEDLLRSNQLQPAATACLTAGRFRDECAQHLWQRELRNVAGRPGQVDVVGSVPRATKVYQKWSAKLGAETDLEVRLWRRYYELGFERSAQLDAGMCAALEPVDRARCEQSIAWLLARRLMDRSHRPEDHRRLCAAPATVEGLDAVLPGLNATAHPALEPVVTETVPRICAQGDGTPAEDGVVRPRALLEAVEAARSASEAPSSTDASQIR